MGAPRIEVFDESDDGSAQLDPETLEPHLHYRFVHPRNHAKRLAQGYEIVLRSSGVRLLNDVGGPTVDDRIMYGSTYLMACQKTRYRGRELRKKEITKGRLESPAKQFKNKAQQGDVEIVEEVRGRLRRGEPQDEED